MRIESVAEQIAELSLEVVEIEPPGGVCKMEFVERLAACVELLKKAAAVLDPQRFGDAPE